MFADGRSITQGMPYRHVKGLTRFLIPGREGWGNWREVCGDTNQFSSAQVRVCVHVYAHALCACVHIHTHTHTHTHVCVCAHVCMNMSVYACVPMCVTITTYPLPRIP